MTEDEFKSKVTKAMEDPMVQEVCRKLAESDKGVNPKQEFGENKVPLSVIPAPVIAELGVAMYEGAWKYGRHNYRDTPIKASTYYDSTLRHMMQWWEGEDFDVEAGGISHITKAIAGLVVLRDTMLNGQFVDDRPPKCLGWVEDMNEAVQRTKARMEEKGIECEAPETEI